MILPSMHGFGTFLVRLVTILFFTGLAGSTIVIAISFVEDFRELFGPDEPSERPLKRPHKTSGA